VGQKILALSDEAARKFVLRERYMKMKRDDEEESKRKANLVEVSKHSKLLGKEHITRNFQCGSYQGSCP
jgi:hypothetical protein